MEENFTLFNVNIMLPNHQHQTQVFVDDYINASISDWQGIHLAIAKAREINATKLIFSNRIYHFIDDEISNDTIDYQINFHNLSNIIIEGNHATFLFHHIKPLLHIHNCKQIIFKNIYIDWDYDLASPGIIEKKDGKTYIRIMEGWDTKDLPLSAVAEYDTTKWGWKMDGLELGGLNGANMYYPDFSLQISPGLYEANEFSMFKEGMTVIVRHYVYEAAAITISGFSSSDLTFDSITIYHNPGHAFFSNGCGRGLHFKNCTIGRKPNTHRLIANTADGIHLYECEGDILVEDCDFSYMGDDSINFHGVWYRVLSKNGTHVSLQRSRKGMPYIKEGNHLIFRKAGNLNFLLDAKIEKLSLEGSIAYVTLDKELPDEVAIDDYVADTLRTSSRFIIQNNHFHDHRARGMLIQATKGIIRNNHIENVMGAGIQITSDSSFWQEGFGASNILIENNKIIGVNKTSCLAYRMDRHPAAINIVLDTEKGIGETPFHENIMIRNNEIANSPGMALFIASAKNVTIMQNHFTNFGYCISPKARGTSLDPFHGLCMVTKAENIWIEKNIFAPALSEENMFHVVYNTTKNISIKDNTILV